MCRMLLLFRSQQTPTLTNFTANFLPLKGVLRIQRHIIDLYPLYFKLHVRWLRSVTQITYSCRLTGTHLRAAFLKLELFRV
ncbi:hypothetical protein CRN75_03835 [Yersinia frederiksenii]|nr:hypothetical protein CRN75_03835 [Yersinia frederiksenii]